MASDKVTLRDVYDAVDRLERRVGERMDKFDGRVNDLESFRDRAMGTVALMSTIVTLSISFVWKKITGSE